MINPPENPVAVKAAADVIEGDGHLWFEFRGLWFEFRIAGYDPYI